jgi:hypothetical protein
MYINRNVLKIVTTLLLVVSLPAGAQVLGGSLGGAANGTMGGTLRGASIDGAAAASGNAAMDTSGAFGTVRDRAQRAGGKTREVGASAVGTTRSRVESARGAADATAHTAHSAGVSASQRTVGSAAQVSNSAAAAQYGAAQTNVQPGSGVLVNGAGATSTEQRAIGRSVSAESAAGWDASGDRSGVSTSSYSQTGVSVKKDEPAQ